MPIYSKIYQFKLMYIPIYIVPLVSIHEPLPCFKRRCKTAVHTHHWWSDLTQSKKHTDLAKNLNLMLYETLPIRQTRTWLIVHIFIPKQTFSVLEKSKIQCFSPGNFQQFFSRHVWLTNIMVKWMETYRNRMLECFFAEHVNKPIYAITII